MRSMNCRVFGGLSRCSICKDRLFLQGYGDKDRITDIMEKKHVCYDCAYWIDKYEYPPKYLEVFNGVCVIIQPFVETKDKSMILGGKGKRRYFMHSDWSVIRSNDIWVIGTPPERFKSKFPSTVIEITEKAFNRLKRNNKKCNAIACFDRYQCFRYNLELEKEKGPYNKIPKKWKIGDEHCGFFIKHDEIGITNNIKPNTDL